MGILQRLSLSFKHCTHVHWIIHAWRHVEWTWNPMTPPVIKLLERLSPKQEAREWTPAITIIYMAPSGHRQWPMSITALLDCLSWIVLQTRPLALASFQEAVRRSPKWQPKYRGGPKVAIAPSIPYKFLDIGTKMGSY